ncbi:aspartyl/asparaginyl beta-hydroxylase domain-containing protein [Streptomyces sp. B1I3]|uniref:aspartyl/asparaginyl beta-hydroxylase domain-containing protein n=1 Tax=Streptomyces sp. B1I3 TaxID=3042264 RepID=UPI0027874858|nr:aspartyl/asparaginyl beta-hydroxylase domain-containing protein [Streptomyces sp. B1I3]MDQ0791662.1 quercetin dioxygenase-like cupin family protein [Streptomyces sp. B1I3]
MISARLPRSYDPTRLAEDLDRLRALPQAPQPGPYHDGEWTGVDLYAQGGGSGPAPQLEPFLPTPALDHAPYIAELLTGLEVPKLMVRLLTLPPGADIGEHNDAGCNPQFGSVRLHVPIQTHPDVVMVVDGERMRWQPGELWWGDFSKRHWLRNDSEVTRVHLVIDVLVNDFVLELFPPELVARWREEGTGISMYRPPLSRDDDALKRFAGGFMLPNQLMPLFGGGKGLDALVGGAVAELAPRDGRLAVSLNGEPTCALERVGESTLSVVGQPPGVTWEFGDTGAPTVVVRGVPEDLYAAQLGFQRGPIVPEQRFPLERVATPAS